MTFLSQECNKCERVKPTTRFTQLELDREVSICKYCCSQNPSAFIDNPLVDAKCMMCSREYLNDFPYGICGTCKKTELYESKTYFEPFIVSGIG